MRRNSKVVKIGNKFIGGTEKILVQSMLSKRSDDISGNVAQAIDLEKAGCDIIRVSVPDKDSLKNIYELKKNVSIPIVADIHFDHKLAIESVYAGVDKIRINPGNIGNDDRIKQVADCCRSHGVPIRIGVNSGSVEKKILEKYGRANAQALADSAIYNTKLLEKFDFDDIVLSMKSSDVKTMIDAYKIVAEKCEYPLHLGVTEAGTYDIGVIKSSIGIGTLLSEGIGDTIRATLTDDPIVEVRVGKDILKSLNLCDEGITFISCPTCGRTRIDVMKLTKEAQERLKDCKENIKIAIMGCVVNGPGEAREADIGIAGGNGEGVLFKKGKVIKKNVPENQLIDELIKLI